MFWLTNSGMKLSAQPAEGEVVHNTVSFSCPPPPPSRLTIFLDAIRFAHRSVFLLQKLWGMTSILISSLHVVLIGLIDHPCSPQKLLNLAIKQRRILLAKITPRRKVHHFLPPFIQRRPSLSYHHHQTVLVYDRYRSFLE